METCAHIDCARTATWHVTWERFARGQMHTDTTRECGTHALDTAWEPGIGVPIAVAAL